MTCASILSASKSLWKCFYCKYLKCEYGAEVKSGFSSHSLAQTREALSSNFPGAAGSREPAFSSLGPGASRISDRPRLTPARLGFPGPRWVQSPACPRAGVPRQGKSSVIEVLLHGGWTTSPSRPGSCRPLAPNSHLDRED